VVARIGGDEFCVLAERISDEREARDLGRRLLDAVGTPLKLEGRDVQISTSIGLALDTTGAEMIGSLVRDADVALYRAKHNGRGRVEVFTPSLPLDPTTADSPAAAR
jgi:diguanylate cyclase (GGDEF)-like protein